jgi:hypothetical protein
MKSVLGTDVKYASIVKEVESKFDLSDVKNKEGLSNICRIILKVFQLLLLWQSSTWQNDINKRV